MCLVLNWFSVVPWPLTSVEGLFWLMVSKGSVYGHLAQCAWAGHHGSRGMWQRRTVLHVCTDRTKKQWGTGMIFTPRNVFLVLYVPLADRHHLLTFPEPPKIALPVWDQTVKIWSGEGHFILKFHNTVGSSLTCHSCLIFYDESNICSLYHWFLPEKPT